MARNKYLLFARGCLALLSGLWLTAFAANLETGQPAPNFTLKSLKDKNLSLKEFRGQVVMVNFWATWCGPCRQEMPALNGLYEKYRDAGFMLFGVNTESDSANAAQMIAKLKVNYPILFDTEKKVSALYRVSAMPTTVLIDRDGKIRYVQKGYLTGYENTYQTQIRELLKE
ncbi:MAG: TlpA family protein disulfide reductase [Gammaproteobacteria bacterium]|nr:TlpA family protein disulfide reductase [Gammaproteobacteria bacterium]